MVGRYFHALKGLERVSSREPNGFAHETFHEPVERKSRYFLLDDHFLGK
jgi:hypothetical protein